MVSVISAIGANRAIGRANRLPWRLPDDLKRFKRITTGHPLVMGRKTFESIGRPLPQRTNIVLTRRNGYAAQGCTVCHSLEDALRRARRAPGGEEIFVIGGGEVYAAALPFADRLYLTIVNAAPADADTFFPEFKAFDRLVSEETGATGEPAHRFVVLERSGQ